VVWFVAAEGKFVAARTGETFWTHGEQAVLWRLTLCNVFSPPKCNIHMTLMLVRSPMKPVTVMMTCMLNYKVVVGKCAHQSTKAVVARLLFQVTAIPNIATLVRLCHKLFSKSRDASPRLGKLHSADLAWMHLSS